MISNYALCNIEVVYEQIVMLHSYNSIIIEVQSGNGSVDMFHSCEFNQQD